MTLPKAIDIMELAGTTDLRAHAVLPLALRVLGRPRDADAARRGRRRCAPGGGPAACAATATATASTSTPTRSGSSTRGGRAGCARSSSRRSATPRFERLLATVDADNEPNNGGQHLGSAYQDGWYGYVRKDLRTRARRARSAGRYSREYCGGGSLKRCRRGAAASLRGGADGAGERALRRRPEVPERRPVVLRRGRFRAARRRHAAADPLDQPADLPAGRTRSSAAAVAGPLSRLRRAADVPGSRPPHETFTARHDEHDAPDAERVLAQLEYARERLERAARGRARRDRGRAARSPRAARRRAAVAAGRSGG